MSALNIHDAESDAKTGWRRTEKLSENSISQIKDKSAKTTNALNAVPSPFSRLHTFDTAFKLVTRDINEAQDRASSVYKELVSDAFDALELIYNAGYHKSQGDKLRFINWSVNDLNELDLEDSGQQILAKTLKTFAKVDFKVDELGISLVKYNGLVIAGTSPYTLMFTSPNLDKPSYQNKAWRFRTERYSNQFDLVNPSTGSIYFTKIVPFSKRSNGFKNYVVSLFDKNPALKRGFAKGCWDYLVAEGADSIIPTSAPTKENLVENGGVFHIGGIHLNTNADVLSTEIFNDHIIKVKYKLNKGSFYTPKYKNDPEDRKFDFLLPVKPEFFSHFLPKDIPRFFTYELIGESIRVTYDNGEMEKPKTKTFVLLEKTRTEGKIVDVDYSFLMGIFPFLKVINADGTTNSEYNDFYKISLSVYGLQYAHYRTNNFALDFFKIGSGNVEQISHDGEAYNVKREVRRAFETPDPVASIYYQVNRTCFDFMQLGLQKVDGLDAVYGVIVPKWKEKKIGDRQFDFSVDFGTTNTFIAYTDDPMHQTTPKPFDIDVNDLQMVMLQQNAVQESGLSVTGSFLKEATTRNLVLVVPSNEFIPPVFLPSDPKSPFNMPFRTAVYQKKNINSFNLFSDMNIHFGYQKTEIDANAAENQEIVTNLKWNINSMQDMGSKYRVEKFIEELCMMFKYKVILNDGNPKLTRLNWFIPQSLTVGAINMYDNIWKERVREIMKAEASPKRVYESEAPYYFLERTGQIHNNDAVLSIDIGGGSTDAMLFVNKMPRLGTSFNFAGNILWQNGYNQLVNDAKENGFYQKIKDKLVIAEEDLEFKQSMLNYDRKSTDEIINFWIANNDKTKITDFLGNPEFKIVYLLHYCSVIYHLAQLLKSNSYPEPTCVIFSGNGSKYIDFIANESTLGLITAFIFSKVYIKEVKEPQVILPTINRKEATSYGGIFKRQEVAFQSKAYLGTTLDFAKNASITTYTDVENNITEIRPSINRNINQMLDILEGLNEVINFKTQLSIDFSFSAVRRFIESQLDTNFEKGYGIRKEKISYEEIVSDSLFFYPLIGVIFEMGKMTKEKLADYTPKIKSYAVEPSGDGVFDINGLTKDRAFNSAFELNVPENNPNESTFSLIHEEDVYQLAFTGREFVLKPVCELVNFPDGHKISIKQHNQGKARKDGNKWIVTEKLKIEFI